MRDGSIRCRPGPPALRARLCSSRRPSRANGASRGRFSLTGRGLRSGSTPVASNRSALRRDPEPRKANRTGFPFIGTGFRLNRFAEPSVRSAERMTGCAERMDRSAVPCKICGERLNGRGFRFARFPVRTNQTWERMNGSPEPMSENRGRWLGFAERRDGETSALAALFEQGTQAGDLGLLRPY